MVRAVTDFRNPWVYTTKRIELKVPCDTFPLPWDLAVKMKKTAWYRRYILSKIEKNEPLFSAIDTGTKDWIYFFLQEKTSKLTNIG